jgi:hypothetical protein
MRRWYYISEKGGSQAKPPFSSDFFKKGGVPWGYTTGHLPQGSSVGSAYGTCILLSTPSFLISCPKKHGSLLTDRGKSCIIYTNETKSTLGIIGNFYNFRHRSPQRKRGTEET